jgi:hypothetical protein
MMRLHLQRGSSLLEFTLVGIPLIFILISIFEVSRGMWIYHTMAYAVKETSRFVIVKGENCIASGNACGVTVQRIAQEFASAGVGLDPNETNLSLIVVGDQRDCFPLQGCLSGSDGDSSVAWPTVASPAFPGSGRGQNLTVRATVPFRSAISLFWPGAGRGINFPAFLLGSTSTEKIQF